MLATLWKVTIWFANFSSVVRLNLKRSSLNNTQKYFKKYSKRSRCVRVLTKEWPRFFLNPTTASVIAETV